MIWSELIIKAANLAFDAHKNQVDKLGVPYIFHLMECAEQATTENEVITALLHDFPEDVYPEKTYEEICELLHDFPKQTRDAIWCLKHDPHEPYQAYIERVKKNPLARRVKMFDVNSNSNPYRMVLLDQKTQNRLRKKYGMARNLLVNN